MNETEVYTKLYDVFDEFFGLEQSEVVPELTADQVDGWDSLNHIRLMLKIQSEFGVKFSSGQISSLQNVGELANILVAKT
ncbi:acyl carrier protein [Sulfitobacter pseudonitzschiae]|uniref:Acyl carrier protein n=1 Tax=Pseudosulfitobacter pseudonitzschiae TaxID=1402135 RepID=A0A9Q2RYI4_9RHOB|nr:acyl carrier protein [Pseudosulfitobacter pseudonitzschiae]MBM2293732.1 acyl carrier protein [Pseudosulfitobacter pseudonitzschiae]MBM2298546.1 acyl carrier protein [Pseudosulfitobacter pseudonitzschiae]MBM2303460.1 acyl carrier protein [Pseudosulfitobacter pseudonitzschiae]MBM2313243.1 acyl carrier protein [Pseudosulfitobacter pseudonitzschiae]MBM2318156.1 acyl carrier protein [Pseudosulfitobacter pseudonitzschiae]|tara:strand:+ start:240 stop:479 length:240 start_codon:yes stop_codon:yes gene_type:complete